MSGAVSFNSQPVQQQQLAEGDLLDHKFPNFVQDINSAPDKSAQQELYLAVSKEFPMMKKFGKKIIHSMWSLLCPQVCLNCATLLDPSCKLLCKSCFQELELIDPTSRCRFCFCEVEHAGACVECRKKISPSDYVAAAFEHMGAAKSILQEFTSQDRPSLAKGCAS